MNGERRDDVLDCRCDETDGVMHPCPFAEEINDDHEDACDCCAECQYECAMDI